MTAKPELQQISKTAAKIAAKKAHEHALAAAHRAETARIHARKAQREAEAARYKAEVETEKAKEAAARSKQASEVWASAQTAKAEAEIKAERAKLTKKKVAGTSKNTEEAERSAGEASKIAHQAKAAAKQAKEKTEKFARASEEAKEHERRAGNALLDAERLEKIAAARMEEAAEREAEAEAKRGEARAWERGDQAGAMAQVTRAMKCKKKALAVAEKLKEERESQKKVNASRTQKASSLSKPDSAASSSSIDSHPDQEQNLALRKHLSAPGLLEIVRKAFAQIQDSKKANGSVISLVDCMMSGLAIFSLKYPSLLKFDQDVKKALAKKASVVKNAASRQTQCICHNLHTLYGVENVPCDTYIRERLDLVDPAALRPAFKQVFAQLQRGKELERYVFFDGHYLLLGDGTGVFSSNSIHCENCCQKRHRDGTISYYHQLMSAVIAHPDLRTVLPFCPEPIIKMDGSSKNDCERNASERLYRHIRREHPHLKLIVTEDALGSNGPHIRLLKELNMRFIIVVKPDGNKFLFEFLQGIPCEEIIIKRKHETFKIRFVNNIPLNDAHNDLHVNFLEVSVYNDKGEQTYHNSWITDISITKGNVYDLYRGGRAKWKIENETFNTLKNQDYCFEHNFGHGNKNLSTVFAFLMFLAFLLDQAQESCCELFQASLTRAGSRTRLWDQMKSCFTTLFIDSWETLWFGLIYGIEGKDLVPLKQRLRRLDSS